MSKPVDTISVPSGKGSFINAAVHQRRDLGKRSRAGGSKLHRLFGHDRETLSRRRRVENRQEFQGE